MNIPSNLLYTKDHEWARLEGDIAIIGITDYAQGELGDVVFVELPQVGNQVTKGQAFGTIEAVKAVSDLFAPFSGEIVAINNELENAPETINTSPYENGWMIKIKVSDPSEKADLVSPDEYKNLVGEA
jgi:glycine cleavage system H protein